MRSASTSYRVRPSVRSGLIVVVAYTALLFGIQRLSGVPYTDIADSTDTLLKGIVLPLAIGSAALTAFAVWSGWWRDVWVDRDPIRGHRWMLLIPILMAVVAILYVVDGDFAAHGGSYWLLLAVGTSMVGYSEELLIRGLLVRGMRGSGLSDVRILVGSSVVFGLIHGVNAFNGQDLATTWKQVVFTMLVGGYLYVSLRRTGLLLVPMLLHGSWDFGLLTTGKTDASASLKLDASTASSVASIIALLLMALLAASAIVIWRRGRSALPSPEASDPTVPV
ncbi:MAG: CPBP family intramembrane glutamic endopeptidase [Blastococcus sp.]